MTNNEIEIVKALIEAGGPIVLYMYAQWVETKRGKSRKRPTRTIATAYPMPAKGNGLRVSAPVQLALILVALVAIMVLSVVPFGRPYAPPTRVEVVIIAVNVWCLLSYLAHLATGVLGDGQEPPPVE